MKQQTPMKARRHTTPDDLLEALLENPYESLILVDAKGIVRFMSRSNEGIYPVPVHEAIGKHISEVSPKTRLPRVLKTGEAEIGRSMILNDKQRVIARIPLIRDGRIVGAAGKLMFLDPKQLKELYKRIETLEKSVDYYREELNRAHGIRYSFEHIIGRSESLRQAKALARQAAKTDASVILTGESGTCKELFANSIHQAGARRKQNLVKVNCAAIPAELIESELFGYEAGAFTGARRQGSAGKFELAHKGTIFLDEIGDMPSHLQVKLMRVLEEKEIERIGGGRPKTIDFRVISSTNRNIERMIQKGEFRLDLFYRLNVVNIHLPPLREIPEDVSTIFHHFLDLLSGERQRRTPEISPEVAEVLKNYPWPGNIRELRNLAERVLIVSSKDCVELHDLPLSMSQPPTEWLPRDVSSLKLKNLLERTEKKALNNALHKSNGHRGEAARLLGIHRTGLYQKMKKHGLI